MIQQKETMGKGVLCQEETAQWWGPELRVQSSESGGATFDLPGHEDFPWYSEQRTRYFGETHGQDVEIPCGKAPHDRRIHVLRYLF
jgi:hypothetical protein